MTLEEERDAALAEVAMLRNTLDRIAKGEISPTAKIFSELHSPSTKHSEAQAFLDRVRKRTFEQAAKHATRLAKQFEDRGYKDEGVGCRAVEEAIRSIPLESNESVAPTYRVGQTVTLEGYEPNAGMLVPDGEYVILEIKDGDMIRVGEKTFVNIDRVSAVKD